MATNIACCAIIIIDIFKQTLYYWKQCMAATSSALAMGHMRSSVMVVHLQDCHDYHADFVENALLYKHIM